MRNLPDTILTEWEKKDGPVVLTTVDTQGVPNSIYVKYVSLYHGEKVLITDNYFEKTRQNILDKSSGSVLFLTTDNRSYQIKGPLEYHTDGELFADMTTWTPEKHPRHAVAVLVPEEVYSGSKKIV